MKILFLDMDGVLSTRRSMFAQWKIRALDREAVGLVNILANHKGDVRVVICSTWRYTVNKEEMNSRLYEAGFTGTLHDDWETPHIGQDVSKGQEIGVWLERHKDVTDYVIIDDLATLLPEQEDHAVRPNYDDGLLWDEFKRAFRILHGVVYDHT